MTDHSHQICYDLPAISLTSFSPLGNGLPISYIGIQYTYNSNILQKARRYHESQDQGRSSMVIPIEKSSPTIICNNNIRKNCLDWKKTGLYSQKLCYIGSCPTGYHCHWLLLWPPSHQSRPPCHLSRWHPARFARPTHLQRTICRSPLENGKSCSHGKKQYLFWDILGGIGPS